MTVSQLVQTETGADYVSLVQFRGMGVYDVLACSKDSYGRQIMRRYRAKVSGDTLETLEGL